MILYMKIPKVKFIYAYPLDRNRRDLYTQKNLDDYPTIEKIREKVKYWEIFWAKNNKEDEIVLKIRDLTRRLPDRSLECFVVGAGINPMSTPFIMPIMGRGGERTDDSFLDTMIHEILHIFVSGNRNYFDFIREKYSDESVLAQNHIIIYAFLEKIYIDLFNSKPIDYVKNDLPDGYNRAIQIVKEVGYEKLIDEYYFHTT